MNKTIQVLFVSSLLWVSSVMANSDIYEPVRLPDGKVLKCITTPSGTFCY